MSAFPLTPCVLPSVRGPWLSTTFTFCITDTSSEELKGCVSNQTYRMRRVSWIFSGHDYETLTLIVTFWFTLEMICHQNFRLHPVSVWFARPLMIGPNDQPGGALLTSLLSQEPLEQLRTSHVFHLTQLMHAFWRGSFGEPLSVLTITLQIQQDLFHPLPVSGPTAL